MATVENLLSKIMWYEVQMCKLTGSLQRTERSSSNFYKERIHSCEVNHKSTTKKKLEKKANYF